MRLSEALSRPATAHGIPCTTERFRAGGNHLAADNDEREPVQHGEPEDADPVDALRRDGAL